MKESEPGRARSAQVARAGPPSATTRTLTIRELVAALDQEDAHAVLQREGLNLRGANEGDVGARRRRVLPKHRVRRLVLHVRRSERRGPRHGRRRLRRRRRSRGLAETARELWQPP